MKLTEKPTFFFGVNEKREMAVLECLAAYTRKKIRTLRKTCKIWNNVDLLNVRRNCKRRND